MSISTQDGFLFSVCGKISWRLDGEDLGGWRNRFIRAVTRGRGECMRVARDTAFETTFCDFSRGAVSSERFQRNAFCTFGADDGRGSDGSCSLRMRGMDGVIVIRAVVGWRGIISIVWGVLRLLV